METMPVPVPANTPSVSSTLLMVGCTQPNSIALQGFDKSASLVRVTAWGSASGGGSFSRSTNHELNPIPLSQTFWSSQHPRPPRRKVGVYHLVQVERGLFAQQITEVVMVGNGGAVQPFDLSLFGRVFLCLWRDSDWHRDDWERHFPCRTNVPERDRHNLDRRRGR